MGPIFIAVTLAGCAAGQELSPATECTRPADDWRYRATEADRDRLRDWRDAWIEALAQARGGGHAADIAREGALLEPDAALAGPLPPPGDYDCRTVKIGSSSDLLPYVAYPAFRCRIGREGDAVTFTKITGSQRPMGRLFPDAERRMVFLGTMQLGDERRAYRYGTDRERDVVGLLERIGERRWRLVFPRPHYESLVDVIELTPPD